MARSAAGDSSLGGIRMEPVYCITDIGHHAEAELTDSVATPYSKTCQNSTVFPGAIWRRSGPAPTLTAGGTYRVAQSL